MSVLSDMSNDDLEQIYYAASGLFPNSFDGLRAVAEAVAAVQAERDGAVVSAYLTRNEDGDPAMLFFDHDEATTYCDVGDKPEPLYLHPPQASATVTEITHEAKHVGWAVLAHNNNIRIWHKEKADAEASQRKYGGELVRLTTIAPAEPVLVTAGLRDVLMSTYRAGNMSGHERTVEGYWSDDVEEMAGDIADAMINTLTEAHDKANGVTK